MNEYDNKIRSKQKHGNSLVTHFDNSTNHTSNKHRNTNIDQAKSVINDRYTILLKDGVTTATIYPISTYTRVPFGLLNFLCEEYNMEIERGETLPFFDPLSIEGFVSYWFESSFVGIMCLGDVPNLDEDDREWEKECLGAFYIKQNYPGRRCSHICTAEFLVNAGIRGKGIGRTLTDCFFQWAPKLDYTYTIFNLVFESNAAARKLWESMNFKRIGKITGAAYVRNYDSPVDAIIYGRDLVSKSNIESSAYRFDKIKYFLETGKYPATADRQEKARLRAGAIKYYIEKGKLMFKGKEVVAESDQQSRICQVIHQNNGHCGINKGTTLVTDKYYWPRIKETMGVVVKNCEKCTPDSRITENEDGRQSKRRRRRQTDFEGSNQEVNRNGEISEYVQAVISEVQENHREEYRPSYAEVAASSLRNFPQYNKETSNNEDNHDVVRPRVKKYN
ncbi:SPT10 [Candida oxycetoniae]|uniref:SPT10 n=1 Tax=Candida oxycetoniae TaxID=497107 RepID=A0AAI9SZG1_9ASCO|nr:SPT10 [Candida oxycetoniae]KAI3406073.2 SPT10 [Candida oxycetoniae]